uniref:Carboxylesterase type B domain-containing protein n=1 Tax=Piliocolobus tephrosceles TaxID=591936 RepID=A0A8C9HGF3_9PRIM
MSPGKVKDNSALELYSIYLETLFPNNYCKSSVVNFIGLSWVYAYLCTSIHDQGDGAPQVSYRYLNSRSDRGRKRFLKKNGGVLPWGTERGEGWWTGQTPKAGVLSRALATPAQSPRPAHPSHAGAHPSFLCLHPVLRPSRARVLPTSSGPSQLGTKRENLTPLLLHPPSSVFSWEASHPHPLSWSSQNFLTLDLHGDPRKSYPRTPTVIDGVVLPKTPEELQAERKFHTVPYIVGFNKKEFGWFLPTLMSYPLSEGKLDQKTAMSLLWKSYPLVHIPKELIPEATEKYLGGTVDPVKKKDLFLDLIADVMFCVPSVIVARHHRDAGAPTYMYEFQYRPSFSSDMKPKTVIGDHGDEIFSVLGAPFLKEGASEEEIRLSKMVMKFWANFARNGNPNGEGLPHWPEYNQEEGYLQIGANTQAAQKLKDKEVAFWTNLFKKAAEQLPQTEHIEL